MNQTTPQWHLPTIKHFIPSSFTSMPPSPAHTHHTSTLSTTHTTHQPSPPHTAPINPLHHTHHPSTLSTTHTTHQPSHHTHHTPTLSTTHTSHTPHTHHIHHTHITYTTHTSHTTHTTHQPSPPHTHHTHTHTTHQPSPKVYCLLSARNLSSHRRATRVDLPTPDSPIRSTLYDLMFRKFCRRACAFCLSRSGRVCGITRDWWIGRKP